MWFDVLNELGNHLATFTLFLKFVYTLFIVASAYIILSPDVLKRFTLISTRKLVSKTFLLGLISVLSFGILYFFVVPRVLVDQLFFAFGEFGKTVLGEVQFERVSVYVEDKSLHFDFEDIVPPLSAFQIGGVDTKTPVYFILSKYDRTTSDDILTSLRHKLAEDRPLEILVIGLNQREVFAGLVKVADTLDKAQIRVRVQPLIFNRIPFRAQNMNTAVYSRADVENTIKTLLDAELRKPLVNRAYLSVMFFVVFGAVIWALVQLFVLWGIYYVIFSLLKLFVGQEVIEYPREVAFAVSIFLVGAIALLPFDVLTLFFITPLLVLGILHLKSQRFIT